MKNNPPKQKKIAIATHYLRHFPSFLSYFRIKTLKAWMGCQTHIEIKPEFFKQLMATIYIPGKWVIRPPIVYTQPLSNTRN